MIKYIIRRVLIMLPTLWLISLISFIIMILPPGDYLTHYLLQLEQQARASEEDLKQVEILRERYGLDKPPLVQYVIWLRKVLHGDFGYSFARQKPVSQIIWERLGLTFVVAFSSLMVTWAIAFPIGFYSAIKQHSAGDYFFTFVGFVGLGIPNFLLALLIMYFAFTFFGISVGGLFSAEYATAPWSWAKFMNLLEHLWLPIVVVGTGSTAGLIRVMRNNLLDELQKPYVTTARAKGLREFALVLKYPVRIALNPFLSTVGWILPRLISGSSVTATVLSLATSGAVLLEALLVQDMYLAGAILMMMAVLTVIGTLLSDILLAAVDPRIRYEGGSA
jgi:peptide/nickel transport system permease protein